MSVEGFRVRFAPSPTGYLHIGSARTALFNWLFAKKHGGTFVLRIEDTDQARSTPEALSAVMEGLKWLGLEPDEGPEKGGPHGPYLQSRRTEIYKKYINELKQSGAIYPCFCSEERLAELRNKQRQGKLSWQYDGKCRRIPGEEARRKVESGEPHTWRLKVSRPGSTKVSDLILGESTVEHSDVEDIILIRTDGTPTYNLAVVIDDHDMEITHVIRGQDHLTNSFKQILIYGALGWKIPKFGHISLILAAPPNKGKLSKRHGGAEVKHYKEKGYHPEAFLNWLALIGWSYGEGNEIMTRKELLENFDIRNAGTANARMNPQKLDAISGHRIRELPLAEIKTHVTPYLLEAGFLRQNQQDFQEKLELIAECAHPRMDYFAQVTEVVDWAFQDISYRKDALKALRKVKEAPEFLPEYAQSLPQDLPGPKELEDQARSFVEGRDLSFGKFAKAVRAAITGRMQTPPLFHCICLLGREKTVARLIKAAEIAAEQRKTQAKGD